MSPHYFENQHGNNMLARKILPVTAFLSQTFFAARVFAAGVGVGVSYPNGATTNSIQSGQTYTYIQYISLMYGFAMKAAIALSILMVIYAGYKYMTSRGDSGAINEAKDILFSTLMGAALLMLVILVGNIAGLQTSTWGI
jgi:hypothetical protein